MTHETHNIEWKQSWRDEYLKWICGFANADGGTILIGKDDDGRTVGVSNAKQLMEGIPNKIQMNLGIVCDVRSHADAAGEYIEIAVDPSPYPVNYRGEFHFRSGATKQVLKGNALTRFIFDRTGLSWESVPVGDVDPDDLWRESFSIFRTKALESGRMSVAELSCPHWDILDKLGLGAPQLPVCLHSEEVNEQVNEQVETPDRLLRLLRDNDRITYQVAATRLAVSISTVRRAMKVLVDSGKVQRFGSDKNGRWVVLPEKEA